MAAVFRTGFRARRGPHIQAKDANAAKRAAAEEAAAVVDGSDSESSKSPAEDLSAVLPKGKDLAIKKLTKQMKAM